MPSDSASAAFATVAFFVASAACKRNCASSKRACVVAERGSSPGRDARLDGAEQLALLPPGLGQQLAALLGGVQLQQRLADSRARRPMRIDDARQGGVHVRPRHVDAPRAFAGGFDGPVKIDAVGAGDQRGVRRHDLRRKRQRRIRHLAGRPHRGPRRLILAARHRHRGRLPDRLGRQFRQGPRLLRQAPAGEAGRRTRRVQRTRHVRHAARTGHGEQARKQDAAFHEETAPVRGGLQEERGLNGMGAMRVHSGNDERVSIP